MSYLTICATFKNEAEFLREWIEFHRMLGVENFVLYNNGSEDDWQFILDYDCVEVRDWNGHDGWDFARKAYNHYLQNNDNPFWTAFIDIDEFLCPVSSESLTDVLRAYESFAAVCVHWVQYGSSGRQKTPKGLVIENYLDRKAEAGIGVKSIVRTCLAKKCDSCHLFDLDGIEVNENKQQFERGGPQPGTVTRVENLPPTADILRLNHYRIKSLEDYERKKAMWGDKQPLRLQNYLLTDYNEIRDEFALKFVPKLKEILDYDARRRLL